MRRARRKNLKELEWTGWHPFCRCFATAIIADEKQRDAYYEANAAGEDVEGWEFEGAIKDMPEGWNNWVADNEERIAKAKSMPYFIRDNFKDGDVAKGLRWEARQAIKSEEARALEDFEKQIDEFAAQTRKGAIEFVDGFDKLGKTDYLRDNGFSEEEIDAIVEAAKGASIDRRRLDWPKKTDIEDLLGRLSDRQLVKAEDGTIYVSPLNQMALNMQHGRNIPNEDIFYEWCAPRYANSTGYCRATKGYRIINNAHRSGCSFLESAEQYLDINEADHVKKKIAELAERTSKALDEAIAKNTIPFDTKVYRYLDINGADLYLGADLKGLSLEEMANSINELKGTVCTDKAFMSASFDKDINYFKHRRKILAIYDTPKGTNLYATANLGESEAILARNTPAEILGAYYDRDLDKVIVRMRL